MKRWIITAMVMAVILVGTISTSSAHAVSGIIQPNYWGNRIGSFEYNGVTVDAFSNGNQGVKYNSHSYSPYGLQYQCTEYVNRFYGEALDKKDLYSVYAGNANGYYSRASKFGLVAYQNKVSTTPPQMGDIICSNSGDYGHVAIVRQVINTDGYPRSIRVIHQNYANIPTKTSTGWTFNQNANYLELKMTKSSSGVYTVGNFPNGYTVVGWLHKQ